MTVTIPQFQISPLLIASWIPPILLGPIPQFCCSLFLLFDHSQLHLFFLDSPRGTHPSVPSGFSSSTLLKSILFPSFSSSLFLLLLPSSLSQSSYHQPSSVHSSPLSPLSHSFLGDPLVWTHCRQVHDCYQPVIHICCPWLVCQWPYREDFPWSPDSIAPDVVHHFLP